MSASRQWPVETTKHLLLPSKSKVALRRSNSLEAVRKQLLGSCEQCREHAVTSLQDAVRKAEFVAEKYRLENSKLHQQLQTRVSHKNTIQDRVSQLTEEKNSLERNLRRSERLREELGQQLLSLRNDHESICQERKAVCQENDRLREQEKSLRREMESILEDKKRIFEQNVSLGSRLKTLEPEVDGLRKEKARHDSDKALVKQEYSEMVNRLTVERVTLQTEVERLKLENEENKCYLQKFKAVEQNTTELAKQVEQLQQNLDLEAKKLKETQQREQTLQSQLHMFQDSSHPCQRQKCMETRAERDQLARKFDKRCERPECVSAKAELEDVKKRIMQRCERPECVSTKAELEDVKKRIMQMERKRCNSEHCRNEHLRDMNDTIGSKIRSGDREYSHSEALQLLVQRTEMQHPGQSEEIKTLQSHLQRMQQEKQQLEEKLESALGSNAAGKCTRSDCQRMEEQLKRMQSEYRQGRSAAKDMTVMSGGEYDQPLEEFNEVFTGTDPDELLGVLESCLESFEAKKLLCKIFQRAYELCKVAALKKTRQTLEDLFTVSEDKSRKAALGEISRAYGLLLHVCGLKNDEATCREICRKIMTELTSDEVAEIYNKVGQALQDKQDCLLKGVQVAWKFVTLPSPIIASQPEKYNPQIVEREFGYWDEKTPEAKLIYTRPVVYRCYDGNRAEKGMVANRETCSMPEGQKRGFFQKAIDYVFTREQ